MATNGRIDLPLSRSDGPNYGNGHRAPYTNSALEKSGSFREGSDRTFSSPHSISKFSTTTSQEDMTCLLQSLASDLKGVAPDPKLNRPGEMKRAMSSIFGASTENSSASTFETKQFPSSSLEGMRRLKSNLQESSSKARERVKTFDAACSMIDKFWQQKKKRSRIAHSSNVRTTGLYQGGNIPKTGLQSYASGSGLDMSQREGNSKVEVPNKRSRSSLLEMDVQTNGTARTSSILERNKDTVKFISGSSTHLVENDGAFSSGADGWESSRLKKKRSAIKSDTSGSRLSRSQGGEREVKRGMQHKLGIDARPRIGHAHSFRPGTDCNAIMVGNLDTSPQHASSMRFRNELNNGSLQNDKRDARSCPDTESATVKAITKPTSREDRCAASPSFLKFGSLRTRTNPGALPKRSANELRVMGNPEDIEQPQATEKLNALGVNNRKRAASVRSSSPTVGHWAVQRPKKFSRSSRRSSLSPLFSSHDEFSIPEALDDVSIHHDSLGEARHTSLNASQQCKIRGDNSLASASLSESEESGFQVNKLKCKVNKCREMEDKSGKTVQKSANDFIMASRKNRMTVEEDSGDGDCREGRTGRGLAPTRSGLAASIEKLGEAITDKQQRSIRHGSERAESKTARPHIKKVSERKAFTRPKQSINVLSMESSEEAFDDQEELVAAATAALDTGRACSSSLWKQLEPVFRFISSEDIAFLREQIQLTDESAARTHVDGDNFQKLKVDHEHVTMSSGPVVSNAWKSTDLSDGISSYECDREGGFMKDTGHTGPLSNSGVSICQTLLSAIIGEEEMDNICSTVDYGEGYSFEDCNAAQFEHGKDLKSKVLDQQLQADSQFARISDCSKDEDWRFCDETSTQRSGINGIMETYDKPISNCQQTLKQLVPKQTTPSNRACTEFQYNQMNINDRLIVELGEIGIYPEVESVPDLKYGEHEDITESIHMLEEKLKEQAANRKSLLLKVEKAAMDAKEHQQSKVERLAMDRLVQTAYDRYKACGRPGASGTRKVSKVAKHATMAFVKRTLARLHKLEETGVSCFDQPIFRDIFSASSRCSNSQSMDISANDHNAFTNSQITGKADPQAKCSSAAQPHPFREGEPWSNRLKKRELVLDDDAAGNSFPSSSNPVLGTSMVSSAKGKRSERDRDGKGHNRGSLFKNGTPKVGRPASSGSLKPEIKCKSKSKIKTTQSSTSTSVLHGKNTEMSDAGSLLPPKSSGFRAQDGEKKDSLCLLQDSGTKKSSNSGEALDSTNLQLDDFAGQGQDLASWLNFDDEGLQDQGDYVGLEIPMDDLADVHMLI